MIFITVIIFFFRLARRDTRYRYNNTSAADLHNVVYIIIISYNGAEKKIRTKLRERYTDKF